MNSKQVFSCDLKTQNVQKVSTERLVNCILCLKYFYKTSRCDRTQTSYYPYLLLSRRWTRIQNVQNERVGIN